MQLDINYSLILELNDVGFYHRLLHIINMNL